MTPVLTREEARAQIRIPDGAPLVVYAGHIGAAKGTDRLVDLAVRVPEVRFLLVGAEHAPGDAARLEARARAEGAANVITRPVVPVGDVAPYLFAADCLVIPPTEAPLRRFGRTVLPMKVFTYLAAGRAILAPKLPDVEEVLTDGDTACLVSPEDVAAAAAALRALLADRGARDRLAARARQAADACTWQARAAAIVPFLERVAG
jgi:glycosyltransferase involved in cell wall biosynthesis